MLFTSITMRKFQTRTSSRSSVVLTFCRYNQGPYVKFLFVNQEFGNHVGDWYALITYNTLWHATKSGKGTQYDPLHQWEAHSSVV